MPYIRCLLYLIIFFLSSSASAHHAYIGLYDKDVVSTIEGEISSIFWRNPHVRIGIFVKGNSGQEEEWEIEFGSVNTVERLGVTRNMINTGDRISVSGNPGRNGFKGMWAASLKKMDGNIIPLQADEETRYGLSYEALERARQAPQASRKDIFRVWLPYKRPNSGSGVTEYPLNKAGLDEKAQWRADEDSALRCEPPGLPTALDNPYPVEFQDHGDRIVFKLEEWDGVRTFYMDDQRPVELEYPRMGFSVGRWNGDTLVVTTSSIDWPYIDDVGSPMSDDVVITEYFSLSDEGIQLDYEAHIDDPVYYTEPIVMHITWVWVPGHEIKPFNCSLTE